MYVAFLKNKMTGFNSVNVIHIMDYIYTFYGKADDI